MLKQLLATILISLSPLISAQQRVELTFDESLQLLKGGNLSIKIADKGLRWAQQERLSLNSLWYPQLSATGAYVYMSNPIEVKEPLRPIADNAKDFVHSIIPDDVIISSILDKIGTHTLNFRLTPQSLSSIDVNLMWPIFAGGKRIYASRIGRAVEAAADINTRQVDASMQVALVESYFGLRLAQRVAAVREQAYNALKRHYDNAIKLEANGMIDKATRLFVRVNMQEAKRELDASLKNIEVTTNALKALIKLDTQCCITPISSLFINDMLPDLSHFESLIAQNNYLINRLESEADVAQNQIKIARSEYLPNIALMGKQTLYAHGISKNLVPRSMVGVAVVWNLFDGTARERKIKQSQITSQTIAIGRQKALDDISVGVNKFYVETQTALEAVATLATTIELSGELMRMRQRAFSEGMATSIEVVDAQVMLSKVHIASLMAYYQYDVALINLLTLCGVPDDFAHYHSKGKTEHFIFD